ncbi:MAG: glycosyltransferase [Bacteroidetes bacterium]|nr:glycosyltransferase [Bacteroidota bacterium]
MKLSVIIVNYNVKYFLEQCLKSVQKALRGIESEIWVVDNNSVDGSIAMLKEKFTDVKLIENKTNVGFSKANNLAAKKAKGEFILFLNPDTVVEEDCFEKCITFMQNTPNAGALGVRMLDGSGNFLPESKRGLPTPQVALFKMFGLNKLFPKSKKFGKYHLGFLPQNKINKVEVLAGAFMFVRKSVLDKVGLFDESFFMYGEDIDLSYRIVKAGFNNYYFPETSIIHYKGESTKKGSANYVKIFYQAMIIFARKHYRGSKSEMLIFLINSFIYLRAFAALLYRFFTNWWLPILDFVLLYGGMYILKTYWEEHIKFIKKYPSELMLIHVPYYVFFWVLFTYLGLGYSKPYTIKRIVRGIAIGTVAILAVYALFPENLRFSRGLIILGAMCAVAEMVFTRFIANYLETGKFILGSQHLINVAIVGEDDEAKRVFDMVNSSQDKLNCVGIINLNENEKTRHNIGNLNDIDEIIKIYKIDEIVFCGKNITSKKILEWMVKLGQKKLRFKIAPEASNFIIGSHSKNAKGEYFTEEIKLNLVNKSVLRKKRLFDILISLILILISPFWFVFAPLRLLRLKQIFKVISGKYSWVGYVDNDENKLLPKIKPGIFNTVNLKNNQKYNAELINNINYQYARYYSVEYDLDMILKNFFNKNRN